MAAADAASRVRSDVDAEININRTLATIHQQQRQTFKALVHLGYDIGGMSRTVRLAYITELHTHMPAIRQSGVPATTFSIRNELAQAIKATLPPAVWNELRPLIHFVPDPNPPD